MSKTAEKLPKHIFFGAIKLNDYIKQSIFNTEERSLCYMN